jgi:hypothetical protein
MNELQKRYEIYKYATSQANVATILLCHFIEEEIEIQTGKRPYILSIEHEEIERQYTILTEEVTV